MEIRRKAQRYREASFRKKHRLPNITNNNNLLLLTIQEQKDEDDSIDDSYSCKRSSLQQDSPVSSIVAHVNIPLGRDALNPPNPTVLCDNHKKLIISSSSNKSCDNSENNTMREMVVHTPPAPFAPLSARNSPKSPIMTLTLTDDQWSEMPRTHSPMVHLSQSLFDNELLSDDFNKPPQSQD